MLSLLGLCFDQDYLLPPLATLAGIAFSEILASLEMRYRSPSRVKMHRGSRGLPQEAWHADIKAIARLEANRSGRFPLPVPLLLRGVWQAAERGAGRCLELCTLTAEKSAVAGRPEKCLRWPQAPFLDPLPVLAAAVRQFIALRVAAL